MKKYNGLTFVVIISLILIGLTAFFAYTSTPPYVGLPILGGIVGGLAVFMVKRKN